MCGSATVLLRRARDVWQCHGSRAGGARARALFEGVCLGQRWDGLLRAHAGCRQRGGAGREAHGVLRGGAVGTRGHEGADVGVFRAGRVNCRDLRRNGSELEGGCMSIAHERQSARARGDYNRCKNNENARLPPAAVPARAQKEDRTCLRISAHSNTITGSFQ